MYFFADLLFMLPLDIGTPHVIKINVRTGYSKKTQRLSLDVCARIELICAHILIVYHSETAKPGSAATHTGPLTTNRYTR